MIVIDVVNHLIYFNYGEHHMHGVRYIQIFVAFCTMTIGFVNQINNEFVVFAVFDVLWSAISYVAKIYASLLVYRTVFSSLRQFPGSFGAKISNFWFFLQLASQDAYKKVIKLHEDYGDFVRIGFNDLSIVHSHAVTAIYGFSSKCRKADWYDLTKFMVSMQTTRHQVVHDKRRRIWSNAFSDKALRGY